MKLDWDEVTRIALALPDTELSTSYGKPALKTNGRTFLNVSREPDSFCLHADIDTVEMLIATDPETFWQSSHYAGWPAVLVRYATPDRERISAEIVRAHARARQSKPRSRRR